MSLSKTQSDAFAKAMKSGEIATVESLIKKHPVLVSHPGWTPPPLHCAVLWNQPKVAELLIDCGADLESLDPDQQTTPLRYAVMYCRPELVPVLIRRGANCGSIVEGGKTALQLARHAADGAFEEFDDLPKRESYADVIKTLQDCGVTD